ncbi:Virginiamycin B lyase [Pseudomonas fluorescens]|uniref:Virginiamycin B lyase n=1 Tax=Pseudomonas fluorescens TaxID=294 RepID=A0A5E7VYE0_PSEFL|nr:beta-propeller fold lactonase family protein [Pseudomonas fluorescens]VVQ27610.1 Virginiamycin B lyase [Pseudomonas fluorescens]
MDIQSAAFSELFVLFPVIIQGWVSPVKPADIADGGIPKALYDGQAQGLECLVDPWTELKLRSWIMAADDRVDLYCNGDLVPGAGQTVNPGEETLRQRLYLPHGNLMQGVNRLHYVVTRVGGNSEPSRDLLVLYHLRPVDNLDLVIPADVLKDGVSAARAAQGVAFGFTYANRRAYDRIEFLLGDTQVRFDVPDGTAPITHTLFTDTFQKAGDNPSAVAEFYVVDQLGNRVKSPEKRLDIHLDRLDLQAPTVKGMTGTNFSPTQPEVRVLVPQGSLLPSDKLSVIWQGAAGTPVAGSYTSPQRLVSAGLEIAVPRSVLAYSLGKQVTVTYVVERIDKPTPSLPLLLNILTLPATALIPPKIVEADANNFLDLMALGSNNATIHALLHTLIEAGQPCWLSLEGKKADGTAHNLTLWNGLPAQVNATWISQGFWATALANSYLKQLGHGTTLTIRFKVSLDKSNDPITAAVFPDRAYTIKAVTLVVPTLDNVLDTAGNEVPEASQTVSTTLTLRGTASPGLQVEIFDGSGASVVSKGIATANATTGTWEHTITVPQGARRLYAKSLYHSTDTFSNVRTLTVTAATAPTITSLKGSPSNVEIPNGGTTVESTVILTGAAAKGLKVDVLDGTVSKGQPVANATTGIWTLTVSGLAVSPPVHSFTAKAMYGTQPVSTARTLTVAAATAPTITSLKGSPSNVEIPNGGTTVETTVILTGTAAKGLKVDVLDGTVSKGQPVANATTGIWTLTVSGLAVSPPVHSFTAKAMYGTQPVSTARTLTVAAATAPTITSLKGSPSNVEIPNGGTTVETTVILTGTAAKGLKVDVLDGTVSKGQPVANATTGIWTLTVSGLAVSPPVHSFTAKAMYGTQPVSTARTLTVSAEHDVLTFTNAPYTIAPAGRLKNVELLLSTRNNTPVPRGKLSLTLPANFMYADGGSGQREFITDAAGRVSVSRVKGTRSSGSYSLSATSGAQIASTTVTVTGLGPVGSFPVRNGPYGIAVSPDGTRAYVCNLASNTVSVIDTATNRVLTTILVGNGPAGVAVSPDGARAYVCNLASNTVSVFDTATNRVLTTILVGNGPAGVAVSPDGTRAYVCNMNSLIVSVIDTATHQVLTNIAVGDGLREVAFSPDGARAYVSNTIRHTVAVIDTATHRVLTNIQVGKSPNGIAVSPDGTRAYVSNHASDTVSVIDTATNRVLANIPAGSPTGIAVSPDGTRAYVCNWNSHTVSVIDTVTNRVLTTIPVGSNPWGVAVSPDGTRVYVSNKGSNTVSVIDTTAIKS